MTETSKRHGMQGFKCAKGTQKKITREKIAGNLPSPNLAGIDSDGPPHHVDGRIDEGSGGNITESTNHVRGAAGDLSFVQDEL